MEEVEHGMEDGRRFGRVQVLGDPSTPPGPRTFPRLPRLSPHLPQHSQPVRIHPTCPQVPPHGPLIRASPNPHPHPHPPHHAPHLLGPQQSQCPSPTSTRQQPAQARRRAREGKKKQCRRSQHFRPNPANLPTSNKLSLLSLSPVDSFNTPDHFCTVHHSSIAPRFSPVSHRLKPPPSLLFYPGLDAFPSGFLASNATARACGKNTEPPSLTRRPEPCLGTGKF